MAGVWTGQRGLDVKPKAEGAKKQAYVERIELQPIDPQTNGPQLLYGLRYHTHITKPEQVKTYHEQVGYWLWKPACGTVIHTLTIPRGTTAMASGKVIAGARSAELMATQGLDSWGICPTPFLLRADMASEGSRGGTVANAPGLREVQPSRDSVAGDGAPRLGEARAGVGEVA